LRPQRSRAAQGGGALERFVDISYECLIKLDDGRSALIEQDDAAKLRIGDRVQVVDKTVVQVK
jgi:hypothetical protein